MKVQVLLESPLEPALYGMALSYRDRAVPKDEFWTLEKHARAVDRADKLAFMGKGHNKFLESIQVWIEVEACRAWWSEMDTYRAGVTKQSESTMHTLSKRPPMVEDFEEGTDLGLIAGFTRVWEQAKGDITLLKLNLPEGFLQRRVICTNYKALQNIVQQRTGHRFRYWQVFLEALYDQVQHPEFLFPEVKNDSNSSC